MVKFCSTGQEWSKFVQQGKNGQDLFNRAIMVKFCSTGQEWSSFVFRARMVKFCSQGKNGQVLFSGQEWSTQNCVILIQGKNGQLKIVLYLYRARMKVFVLYGPLCHGAL